MKEFVSMKAWQEERGRYVGQKVGFVPTMGALHAGHASLLERARAENDVVALSIYVNPTQFNNPLDLERYPITIDKDRELARSRNVDVLLLPRFEEIYSDNYRYKVSEGVFSNQLCGAHRPGHFDGVLTVVLKLLNLVQPHRVYFGEKDFQQLQLIRGLVETFFLPIEVIACATKRENDGLAMSSRNVNLSPEARRVAPSLYRILNEAPTPQAARELLSVNGFDVDYVEDIVDSKSTRRFAAATLGGVRLIDNVSR